MKGRDGLCAKGWQNLRGTTASTPQQHSKSSKNRRRSSMTIPISETSTTTKSNSQEHFTTLTRGEFRPTLKVSEHFVRKLYANWTIGAYPSLKTWGDVLSYIVRKWRIIWLDNSRSIAKEYLTLQAFNNSKQS